MRFLNLIEYAVGSLWIFNRFVDWFQHNSGIIDVQFVVEGKSSSGLFADQCKLASLRWNMHFTVTTGAINIFVFVSSIARECTQGTHRC